VDGKDVRIFCEMAFGNASFSTVKNRHVSPSAIGRKVGLDEKTVRLRIRRMEDEGFIKHYQVVPSMRLFGLGTTGLFRFESLNLATKKRVVDYSHEVPFVLETFDYLGTTVSIRFAGRSDDEVERSADSIASRFELGRWALHKLNVRPCGHRMDRTDWQIVKELRYSARRSTTDLAKALDITPRMTEYRLGRLLESGAMLVGASIDPRKQTGLVFFELELTIAEGNGARVERSLGERYGENLWSTTSSGRTMLANMFGFSLGEPEEAALSASKVEGVRSCTLYILKEAIEPRGPNWIDRLIQRELDNGLPRHGT
jgi:DNA-binding Lrp family transcriptional regulator